MVPDCETYLAFWFATSCKELHLESTVGSLLLGLALKKCGLGNCFVHTVEVKKCTHPSIQYLIAHQIWGTFLKFDNFDAKTVNVCTIHTKLVEKQRER